MERIKIIAIFLIFASNIMAQAKNNSKTFPYLYENYILKNGLKTIIIPMETPGIVAFYSVVRTGSRDEWEEGKTGFAHFFEHMMFRGTETYPGGIYDSIVTSLGADANAYTSTDLTVYHLKFASEDIEKVIELESDRFQNLKYDEKDFKTEAGAVYGEYLKGRTSPFSILYEKLHDIAFDKHTYKHTTIGFEKDIVNMPNLYEYSLSFFKRYYRPENVVLVVVGDVETENVKNLIDKYYSNWRPGYQAPKIELEPKQTKERIAEIFYEGKTPPIIAIAYKGSAFNVDDKNVLSAYLLSSLIFGETSDIYIKLILSEQKMHSISANFGYNRDPGLLYVFSMVKNENDIDYVINEIYSELNKYQEILTPQEKLDALKRRIKYSFLMNLDNAANVAAVLPRYISLTEGIEVIDRLFENIDAIQPEDLQNAAKYYFQPQKRNVVILKGAK